MPFLQILASLVHGACPIVICLFLLALVRTTFLTVREGVVYLKKLHQIPCDRCAFHTGEHRLKCTVNPYTAFTEDAICCRDYESHDRAMPPCYAIERNHLFKT